MFGGSKRRQPPVTHLNQTTANPNATTAAASAFMSAANQNPNRALSSAAAAAALRARPHTPTNVADVQTKRTQRRSASVSSSGSAPAGTKAANGRPALERRSSTASMTERTFRSPSPHRSPTPVSSEPKPPVPQIPDNHRNEVRNSRRSGAGMQNFRTASQKMKDEPPSWHLQPTGDTGNVRKSDSIRLTKSPPPDPPRRAASPPPRSDSRSSVNFSYPTAFRPQSPPASPTSPSIPRVKSPPLNQTFSSTQSRQQLVYDPNSRRMVPRTDVERVTEQHAKKVDERPTKKRRDGAPRREGSQLAKGTMARTRGTMVDEKKSTQEPVAPQQMVPAPMPETEETHVKQITRTSAVTIAHDSNPGTSTPLPEPSQSEPQDLPTSAHEPLSEDVSANHLVQSKIVDSQENHTRRVETPDPEGRFPIPQTASTNMTSTPQVLSEDSHQTHLTLKSGPEVNSIQEMATAENKHVTMLAGEVSSIKRSSSNSPARQARFAPGPTENLAVKHDPLPRSASPIKSAMKHTSPARRATSPYDNFSDPSGSGTVSPDRREDSGVSRKKSVRVSFDDHSTTIVGDLPSVADVGSPATQSPSGVKRTWFGNIGRNKKKEATLDEDEIMKPRPALPSFGSIREKKTRELEERPLVRPLEPTYSHTMTPSSEPRPQSSSTLNDSETTEDVPLGKSTDHVIGTSLSQDQTSRNAANISRFREPLPPVVTSVEEYGYSSDSSHGSDQEENFGSPMEADTSTINSSVASSQTKQTGTYSDTQSSIAAQDVEAPQPAPTVARETPQISVIQPSPMASEHDSRVSKSPAPHYFDIPGVFPNSPSESRSSIQSETVTNNTTNDTPLSNGSVFEPITATVGSNEANSLPQTTLTIVDPVGDLDALTTDESDDSIYSDAYEDINDLDSGGFMSLDAIVESPTKKPATAPPIEEENLPEPAITDEIAIKLMTGQVSAADGQIRSPQDTNDWELAKAFWRGLTAEKRKQLELEAMEEAGTEGDCEESSHPVRRSISKKKSSEPAAQPAIHAPSSSGTAVQPESRLRMSLRDKTSTKPTASAQSPTGMRKTMRSNGATQNNMKLSTRQRVVTEATVSVPPVSSQNQVTKSQQPSSALSASNNKITTPTKPALRRQGSDASDSSFKRSRRPASGTSAFRKTMRQASPVQSHHESTGGSGRFSLRSLSPVGSTTRRESNGNIATSPSGGMRRTLRSNSESSYETKRSSIQFPQFSRPTKPSSKPSKTSSKGSTWTSRFGDSSDEEGGVPARFQSRLNDSSDEEESRPASSRISQSSSKITVPSSTVAPTTLSRPAPVPEVEESSPELPDSDDNRMPSPLPSPPARVANHEYASRLGMARTNSGAIGTSTLGRSRSGRGEIRSSLTSPDLDEADGHGSFFNILRRNKRAGKEGKIQRSGLVDSAARRDTKLERDAGHLKSLRNEQSSSPKLLKKMSISRNANEGSQRPVSAGHASGRSVVTGAAERPSISERRSVSLGQAPNQGSSDLENASLDSSGTPKKKKFRTLRRMLRLDE